MVNEVAKVSDEQQEQHTGAVLPRTLMGGTAAMRKAGIQYLPKEPAESDTAYNNRLKRSSLFNGFAKTVEDMTGKIFAKPVILKDSVPAQLKTFAENIDNAGRHINVFARDVFEDALQVGIAYVLADMPQAVKRADGLPATVADENAAGLRPYLVHVKLENLIGWISQTIAGAETLTQIRVRECVKVPASEFSEKEIEQIRVIEPGRWRVFRKAEKADANGEQWFLFEEGVNVLGRIALAAVYTNRVGFMQGKPPLEKLADLNVAHWQSQSDQRNILHVARVPILFYSGCKEGDTITVGANSCVTNSDPNAKLQFVEHAGKAIESGDKDLQNLESQMQAMGLQLLTATAAKTATGEVHDATKENSPLAMMADGLADALEIAFGFMAQFIGLGRDAGGEIAVNKDFGVATQRTDLQQLLAVRQNGDLSQVTLWEEMQRRDYLHADFDPDVEKDRIASDPPPLGAQGAMDLGGGKPNGPASGPSA